MARVRNPTEIVQKSLFRRIFSGGFSFCDYDRPDQLQRPRTPDLENSRKTDEKGAETPSCKVPAKQPKKQPEKHLKRAKQLFCGCLAARPAVLRLFSLHFTRGPLGTFFGCFQGPAFGASVHRGPNDQKNLISIEIFHLDRNF